MISLHRDMAAVTSRDSHEDTCHDPVKSLVRALFLVIGVLFSGHAVTQAAANQYEECMAAIEGNREDALEKALEEALSWRDAGGGAAAKHCIALALLTMGREEEAALRLEELALEAGTGSAEERAEILAQAAQAWMQAARPVEADVVLTSAIQLKPSDPNLFVERALAHRMRKDWEAAIADLTTAIEIDRSLVDAYILRAVARRRTGDAMGAAADISRALEIDPSNVDALLERGRQREAASGRDPAADQD